MKEGKIHNDFLCKNYVGKQQHTFQVPKMLCAMAHTFNPSMGGRNRVISLSSRPATYTGQSGLHRDTTLSQKT